MRYVQLLDMKKAAFHVVETEISLKSVPNISAAKTFSAQAVIKSLNGVVDAPGCNFKNETFCHLTHGLRLFFSFLASWRLKTKDISKKNYFTT